MIRSKNAEVDVDKITDLLIIIIIITGLGVLAYNMEESIKNGQYKTTCMNNPSERHAQPCNNENECVTKCTERLRALAGKVQEKTNHTDNTTAKKN